MTIDGFLKLFDGTRRTPRGMTARCPAHKDKSPSLSIREAEDGRILLHCFAGCDVHDICGALGIAVRDLYPDGPRDSDLIRAAQQQRQRRMQGQRQIQTLKGAKDVIYREAEAVIRASSPVQLSELSADRCDKLLSAIGDAHNVLRLEMGEPDYVEWSSRLGGDHRTVANG